MAQPFGGLTQAEPTARASLIPVTSAEAWQAALDAMPDTHPLQSWVWGQFKARWGWKALPRLLTLRGEERPLAAALVLERALPRLPAAILYVPRGPLFDPSDLGVATTLVARLEALARERRAIMIKIDPGVVVSRGLAPERPSADGVAFREHLRARGWRFSDEQVQFRNTVELDLTQSPEALLAGMKQKTRYNIRLAERKGVVIRPGAVADLPLIAAMYRETAARDGFAIRPEAYYLDAWGTLCAAGQAQALIAEYEGLALAAVIVVRHGRRAIYMYGASTDLERQRMPNHALQWAAIRWAQDAGCTTYDFWGAPDNFAPDDRLWGVWRFKAGFQGDVVRSLGAWDFPARPFWYWAYTQAMPRYLDFLRRRADSAPAH